MKSQSGSAIIMLFVAVALFGALAFAFTQGSRTSTTLLTDEAAKAYAQEMIAYSNDVKGAVKRLMLRGCKESQLSFANPIYTHVTTGVIYFPDGHNPLAPTDGRCDVFKIAGAGLTAKTFPNAGVENGTGAWRASEGGPVIVTIDGIGTTAPDLVLYFPKLKDSVCKEINRQLGIAQNTPSVIPSDNFEGWKEYTGVNTEFTTPPYGHVGNDDTRLAGKYGFCARSGFPTNEGVFHSVLIAR